MGKYNITLTVSDKYTEEEKEQNFIEFERVLGEVVIGQYIRDSRTGEKDGQKDGENS